MELIPVLDLMGGVVVHARRGERAAYRPIETPLCAGADPIVIAAALLDLAPFRTLYIADLDAIAGLAGHQPVVETLARRFPDISIWVDAGTVERSGAGRTVIGTESLPDMAAARAALKKDTVLSLDHDASGRIGPRELHEDASLWPADVVVMTLARVGSGEGPDLDRLAAVKARADGRRVYAAGGVRDVTDLDRLAAIGAAGVLLASALHDGRLSPHELRALLA